MSILIIGAGPTGLGAAWRLNELEHADWQVIEAAATPGGLASSVIDNQGFVWDLGGHVLFSHYEYFDQLMDNLLEDAWVSHVREAWVWMRDKFIPYPLQNNIRHLPADELEDCLNGLRALANAQYDGPPITFMDWIQRSFGEGLARSFMVPYNKKVWAYDPAVLAVNWMGERVATVDLERILTNIREEKDDCGWGPNNTFRFPERGGTGAIWKAAYDRLPQEKFHTGVALASVNSALRKVTLADGREIQYESMISTMPLDKLLPLIEDLPDLHPLAEQFVHSSTHVIGIGLKGTLPQQLQGKCWMYFPESHVPPYRVTVFSNYSKYNVPDPETQWSLLCEVSESPDKPVHKKRIAEEVLKAMRLIGLIPPENKIASLWHTRLEHGYPTPFVGRDELLERIQPVLKERGIFSRGRFGGWKYEVSNQDHSLMQGKEAVDHILSGEEELTYNQPAVVNAPKK